jgi:hypothetical protein
MVHAVVQADSLDVESLVVAGEAESMVEAASGNPGVAPHSGLSVGGGVLQASLE